MTDTRNDVVDTPTTGADGSSPKMPATHHRRFGDPSRAIDLRSTTVPQPGPGEVLVRVAAAGISIGDWLVMQGLPYIARPAHGLLRPKRPILGQEFAGTVVALGEGVADAADSVAVGDRVFGFAPGAFAGYAIATPEDLALTPERLSAVEAAGAPVSMLAAYQALAKVAGATAGQRVLVLGASGAVGTFAVQVAKALGMHVTAVASTGSHAMLAQIGADAVVDYRTTDATDQGESWDVIVDLAGNRKLKHLRRALTPRGTAVLVGGSGRRFAMGFGRTIRAMLVDPFASVAFKPLFSTPNHEDLVAVRDMLASGAVTPVIDRTFPLSDVRRAMAHIGGRHTQGKSVVVLEHDD